ncbi:MAG: hypothetical protein F6J87_16650 [Spirulina sp. SIO3F2]|nr:hypothetical protein [Spirulina sp. SIO3F2]
MLKFSRCLICGGGAIAALPLLLSSALAQDIPLPPPETESGIEIPVEPAPEATPAPETAALPSEPAPIADAIGVTVIELLTQGLEQAIKGEPVEIDPEIALGMADAIAAQVEQAAQTNDAPQGVSEIVQVMRTALDGGSEAEIRSALQDAMMVLMGNITTPATN